jgi:hypothetical protein
MKERLENIIEGTKQFVKSKISVVVLAAGLTLGYVGCGETPVEQCCDCLVDNGCTPVSKRECNDVIYEGGSIPVNIDCVEAYNCFTPM